MRPLLLCLAVLLAAAAAAQAAPWSVPEPVAPRPLASHAEWRDAGAAPAAHPVQVVIAVRQGPAKVIADTCRQVSDPASPQYGQYKSVDELAALVARPRSAAAVRAWLRDEGVPASRVRSGRAHDFVRAEITAEQAARLFRAEMRLSQHAPTGTVLAHARSYAVPARMAEHIELVAGLTRLPNMRRRRGRAARREEGAPSFATASAASGDDPTVTPQFSQTYYKYPASLVDGSANTTAAVAEFPYPTAAESFVQQDFDQFLARYDLPLLNVTTRGRDANLPGACPVATGDQCTESMLDIEVLAGWAVLPQTSFWITRSAQGLEHFLEWMSDVADTADAEAVHSISFGDPESTFSAEYLARCDAELAKLCVRGITVLAASGDCGIADDCSEKACGSGENDFPSGSVYVTSVGATQIKSGGVEVVSSTDTGSRITSGGGFSRFFERPYYQDKAVEAYFATGVALPSFPFNRTGAGKPDVSMVGHNYAVVAAGGLQMVDGTSASTPAFASVLAIVNAARARAGQPRVGFANPLLYTDEVAATFYDVTKGSNRCAEEFCCDSGYEAAAGWDPTTGLGTPRVDALIKAINDVTA